MVTNSTGLVLITGSSHGLLSFREIWSLQELYSIDMNESGAIRCLSFTEGKCKFPYDVFHCALFFLSSGFIGLNVF